MNYSKIKQLRNRFGYTQEEMAKLLGLKHKSHYNQIENGKIAMSLKMAQMIADIFHESIDEIFFEEKVQVSRTKEVS